MNEREDSKHTQCISSYSLQVFFQHARLFLELLLGMCKIAQLASLGIDFTLGSTLLNELERQSKNRVTTSAAFADLQVPFESPPDGYSFLVPLRWFSGI